VVHGRGHGGTVIDGIEGRVRQAVWRLRQLTYPIILHGPHHDAVKSMMIGLSPPTAASNAALSVIQRTILPRSCTAVVC
jgi:hypothetical protein